MSVLTVQRAPKHTQIFETRAGIPLCDEVVELDKAIELDPENPELYMKKGIALRSQFLFREAIETYSIGLSYNPFYSLLYRHRGHSHINIGRYAEAAADFETALRIDPSNWDCWYHLGLAYHLMGDYPRALAVYEKCYDLSPTDEYRICTTDWMCMTLMKMGDLDTMRERAARIHKDMIPGGSEGYFERVLAYNGTITPEEALQIAESKDDHMYATGAYGIAVYYEFVTGDLDKAKVILEKIAQRDETWGGFAEHAAADRLRIWNN